MTGESTLTDKGLTLVTREIGETDVTVLCQIGKHSELDASRITCTVNLADSSISLAEDEDSKVFPLTVNTTIRSGYGTITSVEHSTVNVEIARVSTRSGVPVSIEYTGTLPDGFRVETPERLTITVKGMKSLVNEIAKGVITIDLDAFPTSDPETLAGEYSAVYPIRFYNSSNIGLDNIYNASGDSYSIDVPITIRAYREVTVVPDITVEDGYEYTYTLSPKTVTLCGDRETLLSLTTISTEPILALPEMSGTEIQAALIVPNGLTVDGDSMQTVSLVLNVTEKIETETYEIPIQVNGLGDKLLRGENFPTEATVRVTGTRQKLEQFSAAYVTATLDLFGYDAGTYTLPLTLSLDERASELAVALVEPGVTVTLLEKVEEVPIEETEPTETAEE